MAENAAYSDKRSPREWKDYELTVELECAIDVLNMAVGCYSGKIGREEKKAPQSDAPRASGQSA
jgi:hypothetical protein